MTDKRNNSDVYSFRADGELREALDAAFRRNPRLTKSEVIKLACASGLARIEDLDEAFKAQAIDNGISRGIDVFVKNIKEITSQIMTKAKR